MNFYLGQEERANENLHRVWDSDLVDKLMKDMGIADELDLALDLEHRIDEQEAQEWARATVPTDRWES